jgi:prevent-host-death family protein
MRSVASASTSSCEIRSPRSPARSASTSASSISANSSVEGLTSLSSRLSIKRSTSSARSSGDIVSASCRTASNATDEMYRRNRATGPTRTACAGDRRCRRSRAACGRPSARSACGSRGRDREGDFTRVGDPSREAHDPDCPAAQLPGALSARRADLLRGSDRRCEVHERGRKPSSSAERLPAGSRPSWSTRMTMKSVAISAFKAHCLALLEDVARTGRPLLVTKRGKPLARLTAADHSRARSPQETLRDTVVTLGDIIVPASSAETWNATRAILLPQSRCPRTEMACSVRSRRRSRSRPSRRARHSGRDARHRRDRARSLRRAIRSRRGRGRSRAGSPGAAAKCVAGPLASLRIVPAESSPDRESS